MDPAELPLRDYHLPEAVGWWPLAPGWWGLLLLTGLVAVALWWWRRSYRRRQPVRQAMAELEQIRQHWQQHADKRQTLQSTSILLRRTAVSNQDSIAAGLHGQQWLDWLDSAHPDQPFSNGPGQLLLQGPYAPAGMGDAEQIEQLLALVDRHIRKLEGWSC